MTSLLFGSTATSATSAASDQVNSKIRFSTDLSDGEKKSVENRKAKVAACLRNLGMAVDPNNVPQIAVILSGGSMTAAIGSLGNLVELKKQNLLDAVTYIPGCSGGTWCMSQLYDKGDWTLDIETIAKGILDKWASLDFDPTKGLEKLKEAAEKDNYSLTHLWCYVFVNFACKDLNETKITSQRAICEDGRVPYPYYSATDKQRLDINGRNDFGVWFQMSPHETGYPLIGASINSEFFDSKYSESKLVKKEPELDLCYLQGIWSSAPGDPEQWIKIIIEKITELIVQPYAPPSQQPTGLISKLPVLGNLTDIFDLTSKLRKIVNETTEGSEIVLEKLLTLLSELRDSASYQLVKWMNGRWNKNDLEEKANLAAILNLLLFVEFTDLVIPVAKLLVKTVLCLVGWIWGTTDNFLYKSGASVPTDLTQREVRYLIDAGHAINSPYPLILRKQQNVKCILSFEYFPMLDPFVGIKQASDYCKANNIPFPKVEIDPADQSNPKDCYIFEGENVPTVLHFPVFNNVTSKGTVQLRTVEYNIACLQYNKEQIKILYELSKMNVRNNVPKIIESIRKYCN
uniref:Cytosolic phospholipase A2 gamma n=1 Tax=Geotrypetes seraphini TaxID=260995 RepID=A0A6P8PW52_GEOSA|nr:cytosolic phospholipase A2 gamma [Geotrypetes seraphini]XP_033779492.1 cytosolic phospholipase A2 gamma [Geotrypetes seraphini]